MVDAESGGRVALRVDVQDEDVETRLRHRRRHVDRGRRLPDAALLVGDRQDPRVGGSGKGRPTQEMRRRASCATSNARGSTRRPGAGSRRDRCAARRCSRTPMSPASHSWVPRPRSTRRCIRLLPSWSCRPAFTGAVCTVVGTAEGTSQVSAGASRPSRLRRPRVRPLRRASVRSVSRETETSVLLRLESSRPRGPPGRGRRRRPARPRPPPCVGRSPRRRPRRSGAPTRRPPSGRCCPSAASPR